MKLRLLPHTCSAPWVDAQFVAVSDNGPDGEAITIRYRDPHVYPPASDTSPMKKCRVCGVFTPANCIGSSGICLDCFCCARPKAAARYGTSVSGLAFQHIAAEHLRIREGRL